MSNPHTVTIKRAVETDNSIGVTISYTTAARGSLATSWSCRAVRMNPREKIEHGVRDEQTGWKFLAEGGSDPAITVEDELTFDYVSGESHTVKVLVGSHSRDPNSGKLYRCFGVEDGTES